MKKEDYQFPVNLGPTNGLQLQQGWSDARRNTTFQQLGGSIHPGRRFSDESLMIRRASHSPSYNHVTGQISVGFKSYFQPNNFNYQNINLANVSVVSGPMDRSGYFSTNCRHTGSVSGTSHSPFYNSQSEKRAREPESRVEILHPNPLHKMNKAKILHESACQNKRRPSNPSISGWDGVEYVNGRMVIPILWKDPVLDELLFWTEGSERPLSEFPSSL